MNDRLWAPWRLSYVTQPKEKIAGCFVCHADSHPDDADLLVVEQNDQTIILVNKYPYNNGHLLICPRRHVADLVDLTDEEQHSIQHMLVKYVKKLRNLISPHGFNVGLNLGAAAGAGLPGHLHWHIVPRWQGDNNFMPVVGGTKVIPQALEELHRLLKASNE
ncbi:MAG: HIT domain-containing protein [Zavarzinella sp.]